MPEEDALVLQSGDTIVSETRRKLLGRGSGGGSGRSRGPTTESNFNGYDISFPADFDFSSSLMMQIGLDDRPLPLYVGSSGNRLLGGVLLHQTRTSTDIAALCKSTPNMRGGGNGKQFNEKLVGMCEKRRFIRDAVGQLGLEKFELSYSDNLQPFGLNPHWNWRSSLFRPSLAGSEEDYYNTSQVIG